MADVFDGLFDLPADTLSAIGSAMDGDGIKLPFKAPLFWWQNGDAKLKGVGGVQHLGGWCCDRQDFIDAQEKFGTVLQGTADVTMFNEKKNLEYQVAAVRALDFALIAFRKTWIASEDPNKSGKGWTQYLGLVGQGGKLWGPVVLSAKGYSSIRLHDALSDFDRATAGIRHIQGKTIPAWFFYARLGTDGAFASELVGKGDNKSPITPCKWIAPAALDNAWLKSAYVGKDNAAKMTELKASAAEWLAAWKKDKVATPAPPDDNLFPE